MEKNLSRFLAYVEDFFLRFAGGCSSPIEVKEIGMGGSFRRFYRVGRYPDSVVGMWSASPPQGEWGRDENDSFVYVGEYLRKCGLPVPQILNCRKDMGWFVLEDAGPVLLYDLYCQEGPEIAAPAYFCAVEVLVRLQSVVGEFDIRQTHNASYGGGFARAFESSYFVERFVVPCLRGDFWKMFWAEEQKTRSRGELGDRVSAFAVSVKDELDALAARVENFCRTPVLIHRDFQSQNITVVGNDVMLLDFQGARTGPPQYDLASLLLDPYTVIPKELRHSLFEHYVRVFRDLDPSFDERSFREGFPIVGAHRLMQALGAYGFLSVVRKKTHFLSRVSPALAELTDLFEATPVLRDLQHLRVLLGEVSSRWRELAKCL